MYYRFVVGNSVESEGSGTVEVKLGKSWKTFEEKRKKETIL